MNSQTISQTNKQASRQTRRRTRTELRLVLQVTLPDLTIESFNKSLFVTSLAADLSVLPVQVVNVTAVAGSVVVDFSIQPLSTAAFPAGNHSSRELFTSTGSVCIVDLYTPAVGGGLRLSYLKTGSRFVYIDVYTFMRR
jgi:hypothetical protein